MIHEIEIPAGQYFPHGSDRAAAWDVKVASVTIDGSRWIRSAAVMALTGPLTSRSVAITVSDLTRANCLEASRITVIAAGWPGSGDAFFALPRAHPVTVSRVATPMPAVAMAALAMVAEAGQRGSRQT